MKKVSRDEAIRVLNAQFMSGNPELIQDSALVSTYIHQLEEALALAQGQQKLVFE